MENKEIKTVLNRFYIATMILIYIYILVFALIGFYNH